MATVPSDHSATEIKNALANFVDREVERNGGDTKAVQPGHRIKFHWPPHPVSYSYHVLASDWKGSATFEDSGDRFEVEVASTPYGIFGRCNQLWLEAKGSDEATMLDQLKAAAQPLFQRQRCIAKILERESRFSGHIRDLGPEDLLKLLYCPDRDIANDARIEIETHAKSHLFTEALIFILRDTRHPNRRSAQWCVLDLFEDLPAFCNDEAEERDAINAMRDLIWNAEDDFARTTFKAGVVLGGHIPHKHGGPVLLECLDAPSKIGRRSAMHGLFHVVEWIPEVRSQVVAALRTRAQVEPDPQLAEFATLMARDIENGDYDHIPEPVFAEEE